MYSGLWVIPLNGVIRSGSGGGCEWLLGLWALRALSSGIEGIGSHMVLDILILGWSPKPANYLFLNLGPPELDAKYGGFPCGYAQNPVKRG